MHQGTQWQPCRYFGGTHQLRQCPVYGKPCTECNKIGHFQKGFAIQNRHREWWKHNALVYIQKLFPRITEFQLMQTFIIQLRTCAVTIEYKNNRRKCEFFVVLGNGQALLGMPDTAAINIINVIIDSLEAEDTQR